jgi:hypothetical protein
MVPGCGGGPATLEFGARRLAVQAIPEHDPDAVAKASREFLRKYQPSGPPGEKHWHGATATTSMSHIAIQEALDGKVVDWLEKVTDEEYLAVSSQR